ncbi:MAG: hypothetical protein COW33_05385 [Anaerolineae bacterium CG17_big_fil_post_rev_8_21_14_2_50_57_27]|nr:MAG: hypothetical protein COW33_05385 [Anaerolineae bacterium CG17_big_fil_post_rev_8_21_14_2_50_57_27]
MVKADIPNQSEWQGEGSTKDAVNHIRIYISALLILIKAVCDFVVEKRRSNQSGPGRLPRFPQVLDRIVREKGITDYNVGVNADC